MRETPTKPIAQQARELEQPRGMKRRLSWALFIPVLLLCLVFPWLAIHFAPANDAQQQAKPAQVVNADRLPMNAHPALQTPHTTPKHHPTWAGADRFWNPGPLASVHSNLEADCKACHVGDFSRVNDESCATCHSNMGLHVPEVSLPDMSFSEPRCASCHRDHKGIESLAIQNKHTLGGDCANCHSDLERIAPHTETQAASGFGQDKHPQFRVTVHTPGDTPLVQRIRLKKDQWPSEPTGLKFPHDVHLDPKGIESPNKKVVMTCANCHEAAQTPSGFKPVTMQAHCQDCHRLNFEPALPDRQVPHGPVDAVLSTVEEFYSYLALNPKALESVNRQRAVLRSRPGEENPQRSSLRNLAGKPKQQAEFAVVELFEKTACSVCHEVKRATAPTSRQTSGMQMPYYTVAKVTPQHTWMPMARFDHKAHAFEDCSSCHKADSSTRASDVLMPAIENCTSCHQSSRPAADQVKSDCGLCHSYHQHTPVVQAATEPKP